MENLWEEAITAYVQNQTRVTIGQVGHEALQIEVKRMGRIDQNRIADVLDRLGWHKAEKKDWQGRTWWSPHPT